MFRTIISPAPSSEKINFSKSLLTIGSCFSDAMGHRFELNKFSVLSNPFGTVYNPLSMIRLLEHAIDQKKPNESHLVKTQGLWAHYDFHSQFSTADKEVLKSSTYDIIRKVHQFLKKTDYLLITLGTAIAYRHKTLNAVVANCHKVPAKEFSKFMLEQNVVVKALEQFIEQLRNFNPAIRLILTVSPVRHLKDTLELNAVSKSLLRTVCYTLEQQFSHIDYFPGYEIMMDDLRDYRFYKSDMIHPNNDAEDYIWSRFSEVYFDVETRQLLEQWSAIRKALNHKPFNVASPAHQKFIQRTIEQLLELNDKFDISEELERLKAQLL